MTHQVRRPAVDRLARNRAEPTHQVAPACSGAPLFDGQLCVTGGGSALSSTCTGLPEAGTDEPSDAGKSEPEQLEPIPDG